MAQHNLSIQAVDTMNTCIFKVQDLSVYTDLIPYSCPTLQILLPGFKTAVLFNDTTTPAITQGFDLNLNGCNLGVQTSDCDSSPVTLPDGIYAIRYSVSPNAQVYVEINHLRITNIMHLYKEELCKLNIGACEPSPEQKEKLNQLNYIKMLIESAKAKAEFCLQSGKAMELYNYAKKLLDKMNCKTC